METVARVRVLCVDNDRQVLLLRWRDPHSGVFLWEPHGGGVEPGGSPFQAACRELREETGLPPDTVGSQCVTVHRELMWNGQLYQGEETFYLARFQEPPTASRDKLLDYETEIFAGHAWISLESLHELADRVEPADLAGIFAALDPIET